MEQVIFFLFSNISCFFDAEIKGKYKQKKVLTFSKKNIVQTIKDNDRPPPPPPDERAGWWRAPTANHPAQSQHARRNRSNFFHSTWKRRFGRAQEQNPRPPVVLVPHVGRVMMSNRSVKNQRRVPTRQNRNPCREMGSLMISSKKQYLTLREVTIGGIYIEYGCYLKI